MKISWGEKNRGGLKSEWKKRVELGKLKFPLFQLDANVIEGEPYDPLAL